MITAVDTSVLLDVFGGDPRFVAASRESLRAAMREGAVVACEVVWTEVCAFFPSRNEAAEAMDRIGVAFDGIVRDSALAASSAWGEYRRRGGRRTRVVADFLIGAHARSQADRLLTRDRGFYRSYFGELTILDPTRR